MIPKYLFSMFNEFYLRFRKNYPTYLSPQDPRYVMIEHFKRFKALYTPGEDNQWEKGRVVKNVQCEVPTFLQDTLNHAMKRPTFLGAVFFYDTENLLCCDESKVALAILEHHQNEPSLEDINKGVLDEYIKDFDPKHPKQPVFFQNEVPAKEFPVTLYLTGIDDTSYIRAFAENDDLPHLAMASLAKEAKDLQKAETEAYSVAFLYEYLDLKF